MKLLFFQIICARMHIFSSMFWRVQQVLMAFLQKLMPITVDDITTMLSRGDCSRDVEMVSDAFVAAAGSPLLSSSTEDEGPLISTIQDDERRAGNTLLSTIQKLKLDGKWSEIAEMERKSILLADKIRRKSTDQCWIGLCDLIYSNLALALLHVRGYNELNSPPA